MKKLIALLIIATGISCSSVKKAQENLNTGNYESTINIAVEKLSENKTKKGNQDYIYMLEDAFVKNSNRELKNISFLKKEGNPANYEKIYNTYLRLNAIQERINPLLPLRVIDENRDANFNFKNYTDQIINSKNDLSGYLYDNASNLMKTAKYKYDYRKAYDDFMYLSQLSPNYKDVNNKIEEAYQKGLDHVKVQLYNGSDKVIPNRLEADLLNFNTYGLDDLWTTYHTNPQPNIKYDYDMQLEFTNINISPEHISEKQIIKEKQIKDGWKYLLDADGKVVKDSLGNQIKVDKFTTVRCNFYKFIQHKDVQITGNVKYIDLKTKQQINSYPLTSGFVFEHIYANYDGDKRALEDDLLRLINARSVQFPSNEQMVYDAGEDLKNNIKNIIRRHKFN
ncbi:MAG: hypothetical protein KJO83_02295 [Bacteroidia bacterium]|nr:hypothetical protein [Bacteroidia bacterium]